MLKVLLQSLSVVLISSVITGCASDPRWHKQGINYQDTQTALADCKYKVGMNKVEKAQQNEVVRDCMQSQGFRWKH